MLGDLLLLLLLLWSVCFVDLWYTRHMFPVGARNMYSENKQCSSKCVESQQENVKMMHYFRARQFFHCLAHHALHRIASSAQPTPSERVRPDNPARGQSDNAGLPQARWPPVICDRETATKNHRAY